MLHYCTTVTRSVTQTKHKQSTKVGQITRPTSVNSLFSWVLLEFVFSPVLFAFCILPPFFNCCYKLGEGIRVGFHICKECFTVFFAALEHCKYLSLCGCIRFTKSGEKSVDFVVHCKYSFDVFNITVILYTDSSTLSISNSYKDISTFLCNLCIDIST